MPQDSSRQGIASTREFRRESRPISLSPPCQNHVFPWGEFQAVEVFSDVSIRSRPIRRPAPHPAARGVRVALRLAAFPRREG